jgi:hypothetical protein
MASLEQVRQQRDEKTIPHLAQYAPVWIIDEKFIEEDDSLQFNVVFQHPLYGWVNRRYRYDGFNAVLYHKGQTLLSEDAALDSTQSEPYVAAQISDIPNAYGG